MRRFGERKRVIAAHARGEKGWTTHLIFFFKNPLFVVVKKGWEMRTRTHLSTAVNLFSFSFTRLRNGGERGGGGAIQRK